MAISGIRVCLASWWAIWGLAGTGCDSLLGKEPNPNYCGSAPCPPPDTGGCRSNADCTSSSTGVCDVMGTKQCVQCTAADHAACTATTPVCSTDNACRSCAAHSECTSDACSSADGSCAAEADVAYVTSTGADNATCDKSTPCATVAAALMTKHPYVKIHGTINGEVMVDKGTVTFLADPGSTLTRTGGNILTIKGLGTSVAIYDLAISGAQGAAVGISVEAGAMLSLVRTTVSNNAGGGISSAGALVIDHSAITGNGSNGPGISITGDSLSLAQSLVSGNRGGGVDVTGTTAKFAIVSNKFVSNGSGDPMGSLIGAVNIRANFASTNLLEFNTFYKNLSTDGIGAAIRCDPATFTARANIMFNNGTASNLNQISGTCTHTYAITKPGAVPTGMGNQASDPLFVDPAGGNFKLQTGSPAIGAANALAPLTGLSARDFDDKPRTSPVNLGAYQ